MGGGTTHRDRGGRRAGPNKPGALFSIGTRLCEERKALNSVSKTLSLSMDNNSLNCLTESFNEVIL